MEAAQWTLNDQHTQMHQAFLGGVDNKLPNQLMEVAQLTLNDQYTQMHQAFLGGVDNKLLIPAVISVLDKAFSLVGYKV